MVNTLPQYFYAADYASAAGQRAYIGLTWSRLVCIVLAAACGVTSLRVGAGGVDVLALVAVLLFVGALCFELILWRTHPERNWYDGRAAAESAKTLGWSYAVCGAPFPREMDDGLAARLLLTKIEELQTRYPNIKLHSVIGAQITDWMRVTRAKSQFDRMAVYREDRIADQQRWYHEKCGRNVQAARRWRILLFSLELVGVCAALQEAFGVASWIVSPLVAAVVTAAVAWLQIRQHDQLASAYSTAVVDLANVYSKLSFPMVESQWALEVNDAEQAISREHTLWMASRSVI